MTGAPVPAGADAVVMVEYSVLRGQRVEITRGVNPGENIVARGAEARAGAALLNRGLRLNEAGIALAASVAVLCLSIWISRRPFGYALKAIRNDEQVAEVVGIRIFPMKLKAMALGAMAAAIAGGA